jgi:hypothetical protein
MIASVSAASASIPPVSAGLQHGDLQVLLDNGIPSLRRQDARIDAADLGLGDLPVGQLPVVGQEPGSKAGTPLNRMAAERRTWTWVETRR